MTGKEFNQVVNDQIARCLSLLEVKGDEYDTDSGDRLHQFKVAAEIQHITPRQALAGMMAKHTVSIYDMCAEGEHTAAKWEEKISDSINYLLLLKAMVKEEEEATDENYYYDCIREID